MANETKTPCITLQLTMDKCSRTYGEAPCRAGLEAVEGSPEREEFETIGTWDNGDVSSDRADEGNAYYDDAKNELRVSKTPKTGRILSSAELAATDEIFVLTRSGGNLPEVSVRADNVRKDDDSEDEFGVGYLFPLEATLAALEPSPFVANKSWRQGNVLQSGTAYFATSGSESGNLIVNIHGDSGGDLPSTANNIIDTGDGGTWRIRRVGGGVADVTLESPLIRSASVVRGYREAARWNQGDNANGGKAFFDLTEGDANTDNRLRVNTTTESGSIDNISGQCEIRRVGGGEPEAYIRGTINVTGTGSQRNYKIGTDAQMKSMFGFFADKIALITRAGENATPRRTTGDINLIREGVTITEIYLADDDARLTVENTGLNSSKNFVALFGDETVEFANGQNTITLSAVQRAAFRAAETVSFRVLPQTTSQTLTPNNDAQNWGALSATAWSETARYRKDDYVEVGGITGGTTYTEVARWNDTSVDYRNDGEADYTNFSGASICFNRAPLNNVADPFPLNASTTYRLRYVQGGSATQANAQIIGTPTQSHFDAGPGGGIWCGRFGTTADMIAAFGNPVGNPHSPPSFNGGQWILETVTTTTGTATKLYRAKKDIEPPELANYESVATWNDGGVVNGGRGLYNRNARAFRFNTALTGTAPLDSLAGSYRLQLRTSAGVVLGSVSGSVRKTWDGGSGGVPQNTGGEIQLDNTVAEPFFATPVQYLPQYTEQARWNAGSSGNVSGAAFYAGGTLIINNTSASGSFPSDTSGVWRLRKVGRTEEVVGALTITSDGSVSKFITIGSNADNIAAFGSGSVTSGGQWILDRQHATSTFPFGSPAAISVVSNEVTITGVNLPPNSTTLTISTTGAYPTSKRINIRYTVGEMTYTRNTNNGQNTINLSAAEATAFRSATSVDIQVSTAVSQSQINALMDAAFATNGYTGNFENAVVTGHTWHLDRRLSAVSTNPAPASDGDFWEEIPSTEWNANTGYITNQHTTFNGALYRANNQIISGSAHPAPENDSANWEIIATVSWSNTSGYPQGTYIFRSGSLYRAKISFPDANPNDNPATDTARWDSINAPAWQGVNTAYQFNSYVTFGGALYQAQRNIAATAPNVAPESNGVDWERIVLAAWNDSDAFVAGTHTLRGNELYRAANNILQNITNTAPLFDSANWENINPPAWNDAATYAVDDYVKFNNALYRATGGVSTPVNPTPNNDSTRWFSVEPTNWDGYQGYSENDYVRFNNKLFRAANNITAVPAYIEQATWGAGNDGAVTATPTNAYYQGQFTRMVVHNTPASGSLPTDTSGTWRIRQVNGGAVVGSFNSNVGGTPAFNSAFRLGSSSNMQAVFGTSNITSGGDWVLERFNTTIPQNSNPETDTANWVEVSFTSWFNRGAYTAGDAVSYNSAVYVASQNVAVPTNANPALDGSKWAFIVTTAWNNLSAYNTGAYVSYQNSFFRALANIPQRQQANPAPESPGSGWTLVTTPDWSSTAAYAVNAYVLQGGNYYRARNVIASTLATNPAPNATDDWSLIASTAWSNTSQYLIGVIVSFGNAFYRASANINAQVETYPNPEDDSVRWEALATPAWNGFAAYSANSFVVSNNNYYRAINAIVGISNNTNPSQDATNWTFVSSTVWSETDGYDMGDVVKNTFITNGQSQTVFYRALQNKPEPNKNLTPDNDEPGWQLIPFSDWSMSNAYQTGNVVVYQTVYYIARADIAVLWGERDNPPNFTWIISRFVEQQKIRVGTVQQMRDAFNAGNPNPQTGSFPDYTWFLEKQYDRESDNVAWKIERRTRVIPAVTTRVRTGAIKCFNTYGTCQSTADFALSERGRVYRFCSEDIFIDGYQPWIRSFSHNPPTLTRDFDVWKREKVTITINDVVQDDSELDDDYFNERNRSAPLGSTYLRRWAVRNREYNRAPALFQIGHLTEGGRFVAEARANLVVDNVELNDNDTVTLTLKDGLKISEKDGQVVPRPSQISLTEDIGESNVVFDILPKDEAFEDYQAWDSAREYAVGARVFTGVQPNARYFNARQDVINRDPTGDNYFGQWRIGDTSQAGNAQNNANVLTININPFQVGPAVKGLPVSNDTWFKNAEQVSIAYYPAGVDGERQIFQFAALSDISAGITTATVNSVGLPSPLASGGVIRIWRGVRPSFIGLNPLNDPEQWTEVIPGARGDFRDLPLWSPANSYQPGDRVRTFVRGKEKYYYASRVVPSYRNYINPNLPEGEGAGERDNPANILAVVDFDENALGDNVYPQGHVVRRVIDGEVRFFRARRDVMRTDVPGGANFLGSWTGQSRVFIQSRESVVEIVDDDSGGQDDIAEPSGRDRESEISTLQSISYRQDRQEIPGGFRTDLGDDSNEQYGQDFGFGHGATPDDPPPGTDNEDEDEDGDGDGNQKVICTAIHTDFGLGAYRNRIWQAYADKKYAHIADIMEAGYHAVFLPLLAMRHKHWFGRALYRAMIRGARHRTAHIRGEMKNGKGSFEGRVWQAVFEPICFAVGWCIMRKRKCQSQSK